MGENPDKSREEYLMKDLKELLGDELWSQVEPKLKGQGINGKDLNLVATNTGEFVPADKYDNLKAEALKYKTDFETLSGKYEVDIANAAKASNDLLKKTIVSQKLTDARVAKVNGSYDIYFNSKTFDLDNLKLNGTTIENLDGVVNEFTKNNPQLVAQVATVQPTITVNATSQTTEPIVSVPAASGINPATQQNAIKDAAYYKEAINTATDFNAKMTLMVEAERAGIQLN